MYKCLICGKEFKQAGSHPCTHTPRGIVIWNNGISNCYSPETLIKMSNSQKERFKRMPTPNKGIPHTEETKQKIKQKAIGRKWNLSPEKRQEWSRKQSEARKGKPVPENVKKILAEHSRKRMANPITREGQLGKMRLGCKAKPTSLERLFIDLCKKYNLPFRYVGDGQIWIAGKNPDFLNINGGKQVVEVLGSYWHNEEETKERIEHYAKYSFECISIWEDELKDEVKILAKLGVTK